MTIYLTVADFLEAAQANAEYPIRVRDMGLLQSALQRPAQTILGQDAYPTLHQKAAALMQSLSRNHALVDGNKRATLDALSVFYHWNGWIITMAEPEAEDFIVAVAEGKIDDVAEIAAHFTTITTFEPLEAS